VEVLKEDWAMNQIRVNVLKEGDFIGEMSLIDNESRSATVRALSDVTLYSLAHRDLEEILSQDEYAKVILNIGGEIAIRTKGSFLRMADLFRESKLKLD
jgi:CRP-like cAMP-binding protein